MTQYIYFIDSVKLDGKHQTIAFASMDDLNRFVELLTAHARECMQTTLARFYRLAPQWCVGQHVIVPMYCQLADVSAAVIADMVNEVAAARAALAKQPATKPRLTVAVALDNSLSFKAELPPRPYTQN